MIAIDLFPHSTPVSRHKEMRSRLGWTISFCPKKPRVGAFVYRNAGKIFYGQNSRKLKRDKLPGFFSRVFQFRSFV